MSIAPSVKALPHLFMPGETVTAAIKKINRYDVSKEEMQELLEQFKEHNPDILRPGMSGLIPVLERHYSEVLGINPEENL